MHLWWNRNCFFSLPLFCSQQLLRRFSDDGLANLGNPGMRNFDGSSPMNARRAHSSMSGHQRVAGVPLNPAVGVGHPSMGPSSRSWHPSPFASDDEIASHDEPQFYKVCILNIFKIHHLNYFECFHHRSSILFCCILKGGKEKPNKDGDC